jgi:hypothetical protein
MSDVQQVHPVKLDVGCEALVDQGAHHFFSFNRDNSRNAPRSALRVRRMLADSNLSTRCLSKNHVAVNDAL